MRNEVRTPSAKGQKFRTAFGETSLIIILSLAPLFISALVVALVPNEKFSGQAGADALKNALSFYSASLVSSVIAIVSQEKRLLAPFPFSRIFLSSCVLVIISSTALLCAQIFTGDKITDQEGVFYRHLFASLIVFIVATLLLLFSTALQHQRDLLQERLLRDLSARVYSDVSSVTSATAKERAKEERERNLLMSIEDVFRESS